MMSKKVKKGFINAGAVICALGIILVVPVIVHPTVAAPPGDTATVVSFSLGNVNALAPKETCTIIYRVDGDLVPITETPEYCRTVKVGDKIQI